MAAELPRPGVEVVQQIHTSTPTIVTPTLVPCVVGVAKQIVELLTTDSSGSRVLDGDALVGLPAFFLASAATGSGTKVYSGLNGLILAFSVNNGVAVSVTFVDAASAGLTPTSVAAQVNSALTAAGVTSAVADVVGDSFRLRTVANGQYQSLTIASTTSPAVLAAFGIGLGRTYSGVDSYSQLETVVPAVSYPDPRGNLDEISIEAPSIRAFLAMSASNFIEVLRTEAFLRRGSVAVAASIVGTVSLAGLTLPTDITGRTLELAIGTAATQTVTFVAGDTTIAAVLARIETEAAGVDATEASSTHYLTLTTTATGAGASIRVVGGTAVDVLGLTVAPATVGTSIQVIDDGNGDAYSPILQFAGTDFTAVGTSAAVTGTADLTTISYPSGLAGLSLELTDGKQLQTVVFSNNIANAAAILTEINAVMGTAAGGKLTATMNGSNYLVLTSSDTGADSMVWVKGGTALTALGLTANTIAYGALGHVAAGDELYIDGVLKGTVVAVAPGAVTTRLKINSQQVITTNAGTYWHIIAKNLTGSGVDRPRPNLVVDANKTATVKAGILRDTVGNPVHPTQGRAPLYFTYSAVRQDVTALASNPSLLIFDGPDSLRDTLAPIDARNPLGLGVFFALTNATGISVTALGVDAVSADAPYGTVEAFQRAAELLEGHEVYALAPLTHDVTVGQVFSTHVAFMSGSSQKGERIALFNPRKPTTSVDTLVASGASGNSVGTNGLTFDTGIPNLAALLMAKGVSPLGTLAATEGVFLDLGSDAKNYSIESIAGSVVTIRTSFAAGTNDDSFYATTTLNTPPLPSQLVDEAFAVKVRGSALVTAAGTVDKNAVAATYAAMGQTFGNRRLWMTAPDECAATIGGVEQTLPGFYMNAGIAGMIGQQPPQQSFTNFPMAGYTRVIGSSKYFSESQMNVMAAGGTYIVVQDSDSAPLISRMALTTDLTSVETRTDSITKVVDFVAKFLRRGLKNFIGRFNITQTFLDQLGTVISGLGGFLVEQGILVGFNLNNIIQDEDQPDTVMIDCLLDVPYPCNYIRITLTI